MRGRHEIPAFHPLHGDDQCRGAADAEARHDVARAALASRRQSARSSCCRSSSALGLLRAAARSSSRWPRTSTCCPRSSCPSPIRSSASPMSRSRCSPISSSARTSMRWRIAGIAFICVGTVLIAQSGRGHDGRGRRRHRHPQFIRARSFNETCDFRRRRLRRPPSCAQAAGRRRRGRRRRHRQERPAALSRRSRFVSCDVTDPASVDGGRHPGRRHGLQPVGQDAVADPGARQAPRFLLAGQLSTAPRTSCSAMDKAGASRLVHFTTDMIYGHTVTQPMTEEHPVAPLGEYGWSKLKTEELAAEWRKRGMQHLAVPPAPDHRSRPARHPGEAVQADRLEPAGADDRLGQEPLPVHLGVRLRRSGARRPSRPACRTRPTISARSTRRRSGSCSAT